MFYEKLWFRKVSTIWYAIGLIFIGIMTSRIPGTAGAYAIAGLAAGFCGFNVLDKIKNNK